MTHSGQRRKAITIRRHRSAGIAECDQCRTAIEWTRERARQHATQHGHTVRFFIEDTTTYAPEETP